MKIKYGNFFEDKEKLGPCNIGIGCGCSIAFGNRISSWTPKDFGSDLWGWWRADLGITNDSGVKTWLDQSINGYNLTQSSATNRPTYVTSATANGKPCVRCVQASTQYMKTSALTLNQPLEITMSVNWTATGSAAYLYSGVGAIVCTYENGPNTAMFAGADVNVVAKTESQGSWKQLGFYYGGSTCAHYVNTVQKGTPADPGANNPGGFAIGSGSTGSLPATADFAEIVIVSRELTSGERTTLYNYMKTWAGY